MYIVYVKHACIHIEQLEGPRLRFIEYVFQDGIQNRHDHGRNGHQQNALEK